VGILNKFLEILYIIFHFSYFKHVLFSIICSAVIVERVPTLVPELSDLQKKMVEMLKQLEVEQSKKCDHELRHEEDQ
jgi:hypothetical protein